MLCYCNIHITIINVQSIQDKGLTLLFENKFICGASSVMGHRYVKPDQKKSKIYFDSNNLYGCAMSQSLIHDEIKFDGHNNLADVINNPDGSDIGCFVGCDSKYPDKTKEKRNFFPISPEDENSRQGKLVILWMRLSWKIHTKWEVILWLGLWKEIFNSSLNVDFVCQTCDNNW